MVCIDNRTEQFKITTLGEAKVAESELQTFLDVAAELSVAGLSDASKLKKELGLEEQDAVLEPRSGSDPPQVISSDSNAYLNNPAPAGEIFHGENR